MPWVFAFLIGGIPLFWVSIYDSGWSLALLIYAGIILIFSTLGALLGQKAGQKAQEKTTKLQAYFEKVHAQQTENSPASSNNESTDRSASS